MYIQQNGVIGRESDTGEERQAVYSDLQPTYDLHP